MHRTICSSVLIAILLSACAVCSNAASLAGTSVTGSLTFPPDPSNYFDPGYGFVPPSDLNAAGTTVVISDSALEFGYDDGYANAYSADFTNNQLTITDVVEGTGVNNPMTMTFTDTAFANLDLLPMTAPTLISTFSLSGDVLTLTAKGGSVTQGQVFRDTFTFQPVPEPSTLGVLSISLVALAFFATGIVRRKRLPTRYNWEHVLGEAAGVELDGSVEPTDRQITYSKLRGSRSPRQSAPPNQPPIEEPEPEPQPIEEPDYPQDPGPAEDPERQPVEDYGNRGECSSATSSRLENIR